MFLLVLPRSCLFCRAPACSAVHLYTLCVLSCCPHPSLFCRAPVCFAMLLCVLPYYREFLGFCRVPARSAVFLSIMPCSCVFCTISRDLRFPA
eukprot:2348679-Pyramimonas_sp.AAC.1